MVDVFLERQFDTALDAALLRRMVADALGCFALHKVNWHSSHLSADGHTLLCRFQGADAESVRVGLRQADADIRNLWLGTVHDAPEKSKADRQAANVLVARRFSEPVTIGEIQALEDAGAWCLDAHKVSFLCTYFSTDRKRMICLYRAPDAESVRLAQQQAQMPFENVWAFTLVQPRP
jgi:hypothetical protein